MIRRALPVALFVTTLLAVGCDSGDPGEEPITPSAAAVPEVASVAYVNKTVHQDHLDALSLAALSGSGRGGDRYHALVDLTVEFEPEVDLSSIQRLRVFGTYGGVTGGLGAGWEWDAADLGALAPDGQRLTFANLAFPLGAQGAAVLDVRVETADTTVTYDFLHDGTFLSPLYPYEAAWYDLDVLSATAYYEANPGTEGEAVWLGADGATEVGRSPFDLQNVGNSLFRLEGVPATATAYYFRTYTDADGRRSEAWSSVRVLPERLPPTTTFIDDLGATNTGDVVASAGGFLVRYSVETGPDRVAFVDPASGTAGAPVTLRDGEPVYAMAVSADGATAWIGYDDGVLQRADLTSGTATRIASFDAEIISLVEAAGYLVVSTRTGSYSNGYFYSVDKTTGAVAHSFLAGYDPVYSLAYNPAAGRLYGVEYNDPTSYLFSASTGSIASAASNYSSPLRNFHYLLPGGSEWVDSYGYTARSSAGSDDLSDTGRFRLTNDQYSPPAAFFAGHAGTNRVVALHRHDGEMVLSVFDGPSKERLRRVSMPGSGAYGLTRVDGRYLALLGTNGRLFTVAVTDDEVDPARRALLSAQVPRR